MATLLEFDPLPQLSQCLDIIGTHPNISVVRALLRDLDQVLPHVPLSDDRHPLICWESSNFENPQEHQLSMQYMHALFRLKEQSKPNWDILFSPESPCLRASVTFALGKMLFFECIARQSYETLDGSLETPQLEFLEQLRGSAPIRRMKQMIDGEVQLKTVDGVVVTDPHKVKEIVGKHKVIDSTWSRFFLQWLTNAVGGNLNHDWSHLTTNQDAKVVLPIFWGPEEFRRLRDQFENHVRENGFIVSTQ